MNSGNFIKHKLNLGKPVIGIWSIVSSAALVEVMAVAGLDFVILDMEHGAYGAESLDACIRACESAGASPLVRVPGMNASAVQWALDLGAHGIVVPQLRDFQEVEQAVRLGKFPPEGVRGYNPFTRAGLYGQAQGKAKLNNDFGLSVVIVETQTALDELDAICKLPGLDVVYMGVYDLSVALGYQGNTQHPELVQLVNRAVQQIRKAGKVAGVMARTPQEIEQALSHGANLIVYGVDTSVIRQGVSIGVDALHTTNSSN